MPYAALAEKLRLIPEQYFDEVSDFLLCRKPGSR